MMSPVQSAPAGTPLYQRLADLLEGLIMNRSLRAGDRMPSVRRLSRQQRVSVPTALQAYVTLEARGLVEARPRSGFYVRPRLAERTPQPVHGITPPRVTEVACADPVETLLADHADPRVVPLGAALPAMSLLPGVRLSRTLASIGRRLGAESIAYDLAPGHELLRQQLARRSLEWGCALGKDDFLITVGATEAVSLALRATCQPGDTVVVEHPTYFGLANTLRELGLRALPVPVDALDGMDLDALEAATRRRRVAACVVVPHFQNPTGSVMPPAHQQRLVDWCIQRKIVLIEDDTYGDLPHVGPRPRCLKALNPDGILCGSFSKKLAPGFRVGYVAAGPWQRRVRALKQTSTLVGALLPALAVAEFLRDGGYDRHLRVTRQAYRLQTARMREAVAECFPRGTALSRPRGGYLLWCQLPGKTDALALMAEARKAGISIAPGPLFSPTGQFRDCIRLNCGQPWTPRLEAAVATLGRLAAAAPPVL